MPAGVGRGYAGGDLVDIEAYTHEPDGTDRRLGTQDFDGPALVALSQDSREHGEPTED